MTPAAVTKTMGRLPFRIPIPSLVFNFTGCWPAANSASMVSLVFCVKTFFVLRDKKKRGRPNEGAIGRFPIGYRGIPYSKVGKAKCYAIRRSTLQVGVGKC